MNSVVEGGRATVDGSPSPGPARPMTVVERAIYRGPHLFSATPMLRIQLDLGDLEAWPTNTLEGFSARLTAVLPSLGNHGCSLRRPGGFMERLQDGTWLGHVVEHVALELQTLAGTPVTRGKTRSVRGRTGVYNVLYAYEHEAVGLRAGVYALRLVDSLLPPHLQGVSGLSIVERTADVIPGSPFDLGSAVQALKRLVRENSLGPTTAALVAEARRRGIPAMRLDEHSLIQLGYGSAQRRLRASITGDTSQIAVDIAGDKNLTKRLLAEAGLPVPRGTLVRTAEEAVRAAERLRKPLVTKPLDGNHGRGVTTKLTSEGDIRHGFEEALRAVKRGRSVVIEEQLPGGDHRILVVGGQVVAVAQRIPARVIGDGRSTIRQLIEAVNRDPRRGDGHEQVMTKIHIDGPLVQLIGAHGMTLETVPASGAIVSLRDTANLSTGGTAVDRTEEIHPDNLAIAEQAAAVVGLDVAGIDFLSPDISRSVRETGGGIVEVNAAPGFRMHLEPSEGRGRDVARPVLRALFPSADRSRIPIIAVTGTNGKSTTTRMISHVLQAQGLTVGMTSTSGVYVNGRLLVEADASGPKSARMVLRNPNVDAAVLETARGGILREGLAFQHCDVGIVLNVSEDHLGLKGIDTLDDLAAVKSVVTESVHRNGVSVLNADDAQTLRMARHAGGKVAYFSLRGGDELPHFLEEHIAGGGLAVIREPGRRGGDLVVYRETERTRLMAAAEIPATLAGQAEFNVQNAMAAIAACVAQRVPDRVIRSALASFSSSFEQCPGRLNVYDGHPFRVIVDYAHNPGSLTALGDLLRRVRPDYNRLIGMASIPGDRRDEDIRQMGELAATIFDEVVFREAPDGRGRAAGEVTRLMAEGAAAAGLGPAHIHRVIEEEAAAECCLRMAQRGDLVVLLPTSVAAIWNQVLTYSPSLGRTGHPALPETDRPHV